MELADVLTPLGQDAKWFQATVVSWNSTTKVLAINRLGTTISNVAYLRGMTFSAGDKVHGIISDTNGMLVWGVQETRPASSIPAPGTPATINSSARATRDIVLETWTADVVQSVPEHKRGAWFYAAGAFSSFAGQPLYQVELSVTLAATSDPVGFVLHNNTSATGEFLPVGDIYYRQVPSGSSVWINLPLYWGQALANGTAKGIGLMSDSYTATATAGGTLRITTL